MALTFLNSIYNLPMGHLKNIKASVVYHDEGRKKNNTSL